MQYTATAKYVRMTPWKVRLIADSIRGMRVQRAVTLLKATTKHAATPVLGVINSAVSNAKNKQVSQDHLVIASIDVMEGPMLKRWHAASRGMAHPYKKRMSHIKVIVKEVREKE